MGIPAKRGTGRRRALLVGAALILAAWHYLAAEENPVLDVLPNPVGVNDKFTVSFVVDTPSSSAVRVADWNLPEGIRLYAGPYIRGIVQTADDGSGYPAVSVSYILRSSKAGRILFPSIPFFVGQERMESGKAIIRVGTYRSGKLSLPLEVEWKIPEGPFYDGQTIPAVIVLRNQEEIILPEKISVPASGGGFFEEAPELGKIERTSYGGTVLYSVPVMGYLFTPTSPGRFFLNKATVSAAGTRGTSAARAVNVLPLPPELTASGAVGQFDLKVSLSPEKPAAGEEMELRIRVSGEGNLGYLTPPVPEMGDLVLLRSDEHDEYAPSDRGYTGYREVVYVMRAEREGDYTITVPSFPRFDPEEGSVSVIREKRIGISVAPGGTIASNERGYRPVDLLYSPAELEEAQARELFRIWPVYLAFLPGPLLLGLLRIRRRSGMKKNGAVLLVPLLLLFLSAGGSDSFLDAARKGDRLFASRDYASAIDVYRRLAAENRYNGRLMFNLSLSLKENGDRGEAVLALIGAARRSVPDERVKTVWNDLNRDGDYVRQYDLPRYFPPDISFMLLLFFYNLFFLAVIISSFRRRSALLLISLLFATLTLAAGGLFAHARFACREHLAVVDHDLVSRRIPRATAQDWIEFPEGLAVKVSQRSGDFRLLETAYGAEGWVGADDILYEDDLFTEEPEDNK